jgi:ubiquinone/menaquinone biosynthesis C-methylase UbiE
MDLEKVKKFWSEADCSASDRSFYAFPFIRCRSSELIFGESDATRRDWCEYWTVVKYLQDKIPFNKCLSICCGFGEIERILTRLNVAKKITGTDIAPGALEQARIKAKQEGMDSIEYFEADLNKYVLPENEYDIIWANGALHHIINLDEVISNLYKSLKTGGYLISNEYVGPNYQQIGERQQEIVNAVKHLLPDELCVKKTNKNPSFFVIRLKRRIMRILSINQIGDKKDRFGRIFKSDLSYFKNIDPSECVRSEQIVPIIKKYFSDITIKYFGGSILFYALDEDFYNNFNANNENHIKLLDLLFKLEDFFISSGEIGDDNAHIICKKVE